MLEVLESRELLSAAPWSEQAPAHVSNFVAIAATPAPHSVTSTGDDGRQSPATAANLAVASAPTVSAALAKSTSNTGGSSEDNVILTAPTISPVPNATVNLGASFSYRLHATGHPTFSLLAAPAGLTVGSSSGMIQWTPAANEVGTWTVTVQAKNTAGAASTSFLLTVPTALPVITTTSLPAATAGAAYSATVSTQSPTNLPVTFSLVAPPSGMTIDPATGAISWTPTTTQIGAQSVTIKATNATGSTTDTLSLSVVADTTAPSTPVLSATGETTTSITLGWSPATDNVGVAGYRLYAYTPAVYRGHSGRGGGITLVSPAKYTLLADNISATSYTFNELSPGANYSYAIAAFDAAGNQSAYSVPLTVETWQTPSLTWSSNGVNVDPALSIVANHSLYLTLWGSGNPPPTMSLVSAPAGVVFTPGQFTNSQLTTVIPNITWTPTADEVGPQTIVMQVTSAAGTVDVPIPVTVTADVAVPTLSVNGGLTYTLGNFTPSTVTPNAYNLVVNPGFNATGTETQFALAGTPFSFQVGGTTNTAPVTYALVSAPAGMTLDPNTGLGSWTPDKSQAGTTAVTISLTNSAGTSQLTFQFPTYFTGPPSNVTVGYYTINPTNGTAGVSPTISWNPPADTTGLAGYQVTVTSAQTGATTVFDTHGPATSIALTGVPGTQLFISVAAYDTGGNPSISASGPSVYGLAAPSVTWTSSAQLAVVGSPYSVQFNGLYVNYSIVSGPSGVSIDPTTGLLTWTPAAADLGTAKIVVAAASQNDWGTQFMTLSVPVYFTDAPTVLGMASSSDPNSGATLWTASWSSPTQNVANIVGYQLTIQPSTAGALSIVYQVAGTALSAVLDSLGAISGQIQVAAIDANGDIGTPSAWFAF